MPMKISIGLARKAGLPGYGSLAASMSIEYERAAGLLERDLEAIQEQARSVYLACDEAVRAELARQGALSAARGEGPDATAAPSAAPKGANGSNGNGSPPVSQRQLAYLRGLAGKIAGLGLDRLESLSQQRFQKPVAELSTAQASALIDVLAALRAGETDLEAVLDGVPA